MRISKSNYINDIDYQKQIIDSFPEPQSDYDRVDFNYLVYLQNHMPFLFCYAIRL